MQKYVDMIHMEYGVLPTLNVMYCTVHSTPQALLWLRPKISLLANHDHDAGIAPITTPHAKA